MIRSLFKSDWRSIWGDAEPPDSASVYTKPDVVSLILDLAGYHANGKQLIDLKVLEPSCGEGAFLREILRRLLGSACNISTREVWYDARWDSVITAVDISPKAVKLSRGVVISLLAEEGCPAARAESLANRWVNQTDFLLHDWGNSVFDVIVGNPPYVRIEEVPAHIYAEYRSAWMTTTDRADLYVPFIECGLSLLSESGKLGFICANRFAKNQYGAGLRRLIAERYHVRHYINLEHTQPFLAKVSAYPAIVVVDRDLGSPTHAETINDLGEQTLQRIREGHGDDAAENKFTAWYPDGSPWISTSRTRQSTLASLVRDYPTIEESAPGTRVGIGIATGADDVFVLPSKSDHIEESRQVPLILSRDVSSCVAAWSGAMLVNPFSDAGDGSVVDLNDFPRLQEYFARFEGRLKKRHCAKNRPDAWYRTIDRYWPKLTSTPKLVIPDIQPGGVIGMELGIAYPHHNLYWISSETWDLKELQGILQSDFVTDQVRAFSVAMRGGSLRYQVQNLRKIRIPFPRGRAGSSLDI